MSTTVEIPIHGNAINKITRDIDNPYYQERPCVFVKLTYGDIIRSGDTLSLDVSCVLQTCERSGGYKSDNYIDPKDNSAVFVGFTHYQLHVYAQLGDGKCVHLFKKPGSNLSGSTVEGVAHGGGDPIQPGEWKTGDYQGSATLHENNTTTATKLKLLVTWACNDCGSRGTQKEQFSRELTAPRTLYEYIISYNANGGSNPPSSQTKIENTDLTLTSSKPTGASANISLNTDGGSCEKSYVSSNRNFLNWNTNADGTGYTYQSGGNYDANAAATLYAVWGGYALPALPECARDNCDFDGWYSGNTKVEEGDTISYSESPELVARYSYHVNYNANGGTGAPDAQVKTYDVDLTLSSTKPTRTGYTFLGWSTISTGTTVQYEAGSTYSSNSPITLYAVWKENVYTVTFDYAGGVDQSGNSSSSVQVRYGNDATAPTVTQEGYYFTGWSGSYTNVTSTTTITAQWERSRLHVMTGNGEWTGKASTQKFVYVYEGGKWVQKLPLHEYNGTSWEELK